MCVYLLYALYTHKSRAGTLLGPELGLYLEIFPLYTPRPTGDRASDDRASHILSAVGFRFENEINISKSNLLGPRRRSHVLAAPLLHNKYLCASLCLRNTARQTTTHNNNNPPTTACFVFQKLYVQIDVFICAFSAIHIQINK